MSKKRKKPKSGFRRASDGSSFNKKIPSLGGYLDLAELGRSMEEIAYDIVSTERNSVITRWYGFQHEVNLYIWEDSRHNVIKQHLNIFGQVVEWNIIDGVKTGCVCDEGSDFEDRSFSTSDEIKLEKVLFDQKPIAAAIQQAQGLLLAMEVFEDPYKMGLINNFLKSPRADQMNPREFLRIYGHNLSHQDSNAKYFNKFIQLFSRLFKK
ncbi:MAG: hypothetical protein R2827_02445 [Bdellovibrionales bacterium]